MRLNGQTMSLSRSRLRRSERTLLWHSFYLSIAGHILFLLIIFIVLSPTKPPEGEPPATIEMTFEPSPTHHESQSVRTTSLTKTPVLEHLQPVLPPKVTLPPAPTPPQPQQETESLPALPTPPKAEEPLPEPIKTIPTLNPLVTPVHTINTPLPLTEHPMSLPNMVIPSHITSANKKKTQQDSDSLLATLNSFRSDQKNDSTLSTKRLSRSNKNSISNIVGRLSTSQQKAIGAEVRRCYTEDTAAKDYASFVAHLIVTVDATGEARIVQFSPETQARMNTDPSYRALAERARAAVLSPTCAKLPIPKKLLGQPRQLKFVFRP